MSDVIVIMGYIFMFLSIPLTLFCVILSLMAANSFRRRRNATASMYYAALLVGAIVIIMTGYSIRYSQPWLGFLANFIYVSIWFSLPNLINHLSGRKGA